MQGDVRAQAVDLHFGADPANQDEQLVCHVDGGQPLPCRGNSVLQLSFCREPRFAECRRIGIEAAAASQHFGSQGRLARAVISTINPKRSSNCGRNGPSSGFMEPINMKCGTHHLQAFAFHDVDSRRRGIQQQIDKVIGQQIDLINVQDAPVRPCQEPRLERLPAFTRHLLQVDRPHDAIFGVLSGSSTKGTATQWS